jgi:hypothetical protein
MFIGQGERVGFYSNKTEDSKYIYQYKKDMIEKKKKMVV